MPAYGEFPGINPCRYLIPVTELKCDNEKFL